MNLHLSGKTAFISGSTAGIGYAIAAALARSADEVERAFFQHMRPTSLIRRFAAPEEVASLVAWVASPVSSATTGAALRVDGGTVKSAF